MSFFTKSKITPDKGNQAIYLYKKLLIKDTVKQPQLIYSKVSILFFSISCFPISRYAPDNIAYCPGLPVYGLIELIP